MALRQTVSLDDYLSWPEAKPYREYMYGEVREKPMPNDAHALVQVALSRRLDEWADTAGGEVYSELRCLLNAKGARHAVIPDVAWFKPGQKKKDPKGRVISAPELAVEILSPDDRYGDVEEKVTLYLEAGVPLVWVVDPQARHITVHRQGQPSTLLRQSDTLAGLPGFSLAVGDLFKKL